MAHNKSTNKNASSIKTDNSNYEKLEKNGLKRIEISELPREIPFTLLSKMTL